MKKFTFHTVNKKGVSKCHKLHVGKHNTNCPKLKIHNTEMEDVKEQLYLGDIITANGKNTSNINARVSKGVGIISNIFEI